jgi:hypothetical protein
MEDLEQLTPSSIYREDMFVAARAKINITNLAKDRLFVPISDKRSIIVFIHYEKVQRICTFCAGFFHNTDECSYSNHSHRCPLLDALTSVNIHSVRLLGFLQLLAAEIKSFDVNNNNNKNPLV